MTGATLGPLFDAAQAAAARDAAVAQVGENASAYWMRQAQRAIHQCATTLSEFTTDDVWRILGDVPGPHDGRAMGAAMREAQAAGLVQPTDRFRNSEQVSNHGRPVRLWRRVEA